MAYLINSKEELKGLFSAVDANFNWPSIKSFVEDCERDIIGETIGEDALEYFRNNLVGLSGVKLKVLATLQRSVAYLAIFNWSQTAIYRFTDKALYISKSTDGAIISDKKLKDLKAYCQEKGFTHLDKAIELMENNLVEFPTYSDSGIRQNLLQGFIKTGQDFSLQRRLSNPRITFLSIYSVMLDKQEEYLPEAMTPAYYEIFKEKFLDDELSLAERKILPFVKKAMAFLTLADSMKQLPVIINPEGVFINYYNSGQDYEKQNPADAARIQFLSDDHQDKGERKINELREYLVNNAASFPDYTAPVETDTNYNSQDSGFYLM